MRVVDADDIERAREAAAFQRGKESIKRVVKQLVADGELVAAPKRPQASPTARPTRHACKGTDPVSGNHGRITWRRTSAAASRVE